MPGMYPVWQSPGEDQLFYIAQQLRIELGALCPALVQRIRLAQLMNTKSRRDIGKIIFKAGRGDLVIPRTVGRVTLPGVSRDPMEGHQPHSLRVCVRLGASHPAFSSGDGLVRIERITTDFGRGADGLPWPGLTLTEP